MSPSATELSNHTALRATTVHRSLAFDKSPVPRDEWYVMTLLGHPVGFSHDSYGPTTWHGSPAWRFQEEFHLSFGPSTGFTTTAIYVTRPDGSRLESNSTRDTTSEHVATHMLYEPRFIDATATHTPRGPAGASSTVQRTRIPIPAGAVLTPETPYELETADLRPGNVIKQWVVDTDKLKVQQQIATVGNKEPVELPERGTVMAWRVRIHSMGDPDDYALWVDNKGETVRVNLPLRGLTIVGVVTPQHNLAPHRPYVPVWKIGVGALAVSPPIHRPREVNVLDLTIAGSPPSVKPPSDGPQTVVDQAQGTLDISVAMPGTPPQTLAMALARVNMSIAGQAAAATLAPVIVPAPTGDRELSKDEATTLLAATATITSSAPEITARASALTGHASGARQKAMILRDWVNQKMKEDSHLTTVRTAVDILRNPRGVCRDYATLYAALARAAGIPTRICVGLIYDNGGFWGHAWTESWVGDWLPVDPTMEGHFVDATHIKLAQGDSTEVMENGAAALLALAASHSRLQIQWVQPEAAR